MLPTSSFAVSFKIIQSRFTSCTCILIYCTREPTDIVIPVLNAQTFWGLTVESWACYHCWPVHLDLRDHSYTEHTIFSKYYTNSDIILQTVQIISLSAGKHVYESTLKGIQLTNYVPVLFSCFQHLCLSWWVVFTGVGKLASKWQNNNWI